MYPANRDEILSGLQDLISRMEKLCKQDDGEVTDERVLEIRCKIMKHIIFQVDNSLGDFQDMLDTMDYYEDEKYDEARSLVLRLEELTGELVAVLRQYGKY